MCIVLFLMNNNLTCRVVCHACSAAGIYTTVCTSIMRVWVWVCVRAFFSIISVVVVVVGRVHHHGDKDFDEYHDKTPAGPRGQTIASPIIVVFVTRRRRRHNHRRRRRHLQRYNIIHTLALAYTHHAELLLLYRCNDAVYEIYIRTSHGVFFLFFNFFYSLIFVRSVSARPVSVGNYSVISVTLPLLYDDVIIKHI